MKKVLYVIDHLGGGGAENQFIETVSRVHAAGHGVLCYLSEQKGVRYDVLRGRGVKIEVSEHGGEGRDTFRAMFQLRRLISDYRPDILHSYLTYSTFLSAAALVGHGHSPFFVATDFSSPERVLDEVRLGFMKKALMKWSYGKLDRFVTTSSQVKEEMLSLGYIAPAKMKVIHEGVDLKRYRPKEKAEVRRELKIPLERKVVTVVGTLVERKGHIYLFEALRDVCGEFGDLTLYVVGEGPFKETLEHKARELAIAENVVFTGYREDASMFINAADVFVLPSLYEGMPNVVMEAMALGTPVITTGQYGALDLIEDGETGILTGPGDVVGIRDGILKFLRNADFSRGVAQKAQEKIQGFDFSRVSEEYARLYEEIAR
jgi:glycosyltransferase involved in cell wall biosynthesis